MSEKVKEYEILLLKQIRNERLTEAEGNRFCDLDSEFQDQGIKDENGNPINCSLCKKLGLSPSQSHNIHGCVIRGEEYCLQKDWTCETCPKLGHPCKGCDGRGKGTEISVCPRHEHKWKVFQDNSVIKAEECECHMTRVLSKITGKTTYFPISKKYAKVPS